MITTTHINAGARGNLRLAEDDLDTPIRPNQPLAPSPPVYEWSSAAAYAGLSRAGFPNVKRGLELLGEHARRVVCVVPALANLDPASAPSASIGVLAAAAART